MDSGYGKRPMWQWVVIYAVIGVVVYGAIYYFVFAKKGGGYSVSPVYNIQPTSSAPTSAEVPTRSVTQPTSKAAVQISGFKFAPMALTVKVGDSVSFTNEDSTGHSATADDNSFDTGVFGQGESKTITFSKAGTFSYHCSIHPTMKGTITVTP